MANTGTGGGIAAMVDEVRAIVARTETRCRKNVADYWRAGRRLFELRRRLPHGDFLATLEQVGIARPTAYRWIDLANAWDSAEAAGRFSSIKRAMLAADPDCETCPACGGAKRPTFELCRSCAADEPPRQTRIEFLEDEVTTLKQRTADLERQLEDERAKLEAEKAALLARIAELEAPRLSDVEASLRAELAARDAEVARLRDDLAERALGAVVRPFPPLEPEAPKLRDQIRSLSDSLAAVGSDNERLRAENEQQARTLAAAGLPPAVGESSHVRSLEHRSKVPLTSGSGSGRQGNRNQNGHGRAGPPTADAQRTLRAVRGLFG